MAAASSPSAMVAPGHPRAAAAVTTTDDLYDQAMDFTMDDFAVPKLTPEHGNVPTSSAAVYDDDFIDEIMRTY